MATLSMSALRQLPLLFLHMLSLLHFFWSVLHLYLLSKLRSILAFITNIPVLWTYEMLLNFVCIAFSIHSFLLRYNWHVISCTHLMWKTRYVWTHTYIHQETITINKTFYFWRFQFLMCFFMNYAFVICKKFFFKPRNKIGIKEYIAAKFWMLSL